MSGNSIGKLTLIASCDSIDMRISSIFLSDAKKSQKSQLMDYDSLFFEGSSCTRRPEPTFWKSSCSLKFSMTTSGHCMLMYVLLCYAHREYLCLDDNHISSHIQKLYFLLV